MKKKILKFVRIALITLLTLAILSSIGISIFTGTQVAAGLVKQNESKDTKEASIYQLNEWSYDQKAFESTYTKEMLETKAEDGVIAPFAYISSSEITKNRAVILIHGLGGDHVSVYPQAQMYLENGWQVLAMDQRASGDSTEENVTFGYYEKLDVQAIVDYARNSLEMETVIVHGISMGGATAGLYGGTEHAANNTDAIIMDSAFDSMENMFMIVWEDMDTDIPTDYAIGCGDIALRLQYGFSFDDADATLALNDCTVPVLQIHSLQDSLVDEAMANRLFNSIGCESKEFWAVDSKHIDGYIDYPVEYKEKVLSFLSTYLETE